MMASSGCHFLDSTLGPCRSSSATWPWVTASVATNEISTVLASVTRPIGHILAVAGRQSLQGPSRTTGTGGIPSVVAAAAAGARYGARDRSAYDGRERRGGVERRLRPPCRVGGCVSSGILDILLVGFGC